MNPVKQPDGAFDVALRARTGEYVQSLRTYTKKLNSIAARLVRAGEDPQAHSALLSAFANCFLDSGTLNTLATNLAAEWEEVLSSSFLRLDSTLREICRARAWRLDGQWPDFTIEYGVPIHIDEKCRKISIGDSTQVALGELENSLSVATAGLIPENFSPSLFLTQLAGVYDKLSSKPGDQVPIFEIYRELVIQTQPARLWRNAMAASFTPLTINQFRARFARTLQHGALAVSDGRGLRLFPALHPKDAVFLYQPLENRFGYVGRIEFRDPEAPDVA